MIEQRETINTNNDTQEKYLHHGQFTKDQSGGMMALSMSVGASRKIIEEVRVRSRSLVITHL